MKFLLALILALIPLALSAQMTDRILVLGSARGELFDIEDRILREEVARLLVKSGYPVVNVLEIEKEFRENALDPRTSNTAEISRLASNLKALWVARGYFSKKTELFKYTLIMQNIPTGRQYRAEIPLDHRGTPVEYWQKFARQSSDEIIKIISESQKIDTGTAR